MRYSVSPRENPNRRGPKPMENRTTFTPRAFAAMKWPSSWTKMSPPRRRTIEAALKRKSEAMPAEPVLVLAGEARARFTSWRLVACAARPSQHLARSGSQVLQLNAELDRRSQVHGRVWVQDLAPRTR